MLILNVLDVGGFSYHLDELLAGISVLENVADVAGGGSGVERNVDRVMDTTEPARDCFTQCQLKLGANSSGPVGDGP